MYEGAFLLFGRHFLLYSSTHFSGQGNFRINCSFISGGLLLAAPTASEVKWSGAQHNENHGNPFPLLIFLEAKGNGFPTKCVFFQIVSGIMSSIEVRTVDVVQYVKPLREGGSLPAIVEADDGFPYVLKFRGAGQGKKALIAELIGGLLAKEIGLKVPELVFMNLDDSFSKTEPDEEIQDLLKFSVGLNLGLHFLSGAITYDPLAFEVDAYTASKVVLLDSLINNIDRTWKNTNLLTWNRELWLIDHGASLYFHHNWKNWRDYLTRTFPKVKDHVLLGCANHLEEASGDIELSLSEEKINAIISLIPEEWLSDISEELTSEDMRNAYQLFLTAQLDQIDILVKEAKDAQ